MGSSCTKAHSTEELQEWIQRVKVAVKKKKQAMKEGLLSYQDRLIAEYQKCSNEVLIVSRGRQGGSVSLWYPGVFSELGKGAHGFQQSHRQRWARCRKGS